MSAPAQPRPAGDASQVTSSRTAAGTEGSFAAGQPRPSAGSRANAPTPPRPAGDRPTGPAGNPHGSAVDGVPPRPARDPRTAAVGEPASAGRPGARGGASYEGSGADGVPAVETTTRLRAIRDTDPPPAARPLPVTAPRRPEDDEVPSAPRRPGTGPGRPARLPEEAPSAARPGASPSRAHAGSAQAYGPYGAPQAYAVPPETLVETTTRLRPIRERRVGAVVAAGVCLVVGLGLIGGAVTGVVLAATNVGKPAEPVGYSQAKTLWHSAPVDTLFPRTLSGADAGPGEAARTWTRVVVAPDAACSATVLPASVLTALSPVGCDRVLRATYTDATTSSVITVGLAFTGAEPAAMRTLGGTQLGTDVPPPLSAPGTVAERFGADQRASWWTRSLADLPVVVFSVSGFADGRRIDQPEPAAEAMAADRTSAPAQAGLGHEAKGVADGIERGLRKTVAEAVKKDEDR
ncbi:hypothetical protein [Streptomyces sp. NPDC093600]|uniref:hypothetical protein n=1 Tax=Streptomyces sp. NPDC093600 TaxID=3366047 RepID=UPI0038185D0B